MVGQKDETPMKPYAKTLEQIDGRRAPRGGLAKSREVVSLRRLNRKSIRRALKRSARMWQGRGSV